MNDTPKDKEKSKWAGSRGVSNFMKLCERISARAGDAELIKEALAAGLGVHELWLDGGRAMHVAARAGRSDLVAELITAGGDMHATTCWGFTPADEAASQGNIKCLNAMISAGYDVNQKGIDGFTLLMRACANASSGDQVNINKCIVFLIKAGACPKALNKYNQSAVALAAQTGFPEKIRKLSRAGAPVNSFDTNDVTPLGEALNGGHIDCAKALLSLGASVEAKNEKTGETELMRAAEIGNLVGVQFLIKEGAALNAESKNRWTAAGLAAANGHSQVLSWALDNGGDWTKGGEGGVDLREILRQAIVPHELRSQCLEVVRRCEALKEACDLKSELQVVKGLVKGIKAGGLRL